uniref:Uncharacterized protein n=1 Tax=Candidatus Kentrum sp. MB TaxID=2138164 RepID=A0A450X593_9GAMM|nr:MAG: hypothetical protein BECKMB1821G_GA0114241_100864 [Candidatus Kentron sp. MB]VFK30734.1 MAG: hypothetical protein BECKMB1821I_GA0114274_101739 [Candidatus Kentron sp. MB]VFK75328.1 MAG: hypothetical protein BECKMB1821H_GA0114242_10203 [Candidatus Kentron sp. MB]
MNNPKTNLLVLRLILTFYTVAFLLGFVLAVLPWQMLSDFLFYWGGNMGDPMSDSEMSRFVVRQTFVTLGFLGILFAILAVNPLKYGLILPIIAYGLILYGFFYLILAIGLYGLWMYWVDVLLCIGGGALLYVFQKRARETNFA